MIAKPIPIHIKSTKKPFHSENQSPIFAKIQTKLSSFDSSANKNNGNKNFPCNQTTGGEEVNRIISNTYPSFDNSIDTIKKWSTVDFHEANLKVCSIDISS